MRSTSAAAGSAVFFVIAPGTVAGLIPWSITRWSVAQEISGFWPARFAGVVLIIAGIALLVDCFVRFAREGLGTPAPILPTQHLVVGGVYRYVRNPIYVGVVSAILGQALYFVDPRLVEYAALVWLAFHLFVLIYEEPTLKRTFGVEYETFRRNVPRWIPRLRPWDGEPAR